MVFWSLLAIPAYPVFEHGVSSQSIWRGQSRGWPLEHARQLQQTGTYTWNAFAGPALNVAEEASKYLALDHEFQEVGYGQLHCAKTGEWARVPEIAEGMKPIWMVPDQWTRQDDGLRIYWRRLGINLAILGGVLLIVGGFVYMRVNRRGLSIGLKEFLFIVLLIGMPAALYARFSNLHSREMAIANLENIKVSEIKKAREPTWLFRLCGPRINFMDHFTKLYVNLESYAQARSDDESQRQFKLLKHIEDATIVDINESTFPLVLNLKRLEYLKLLSPDFTEDNWLAMRKFKHIRELHITQRWDDPVLELPPEFDKFLGSLQFVEYLVIADVRLTNQHLQIIRRLKSLKELNINSCILDPNAIEYLVDRPQLEKLNVSGCQLSENDIQKLKTEYHDRPLIY